MLAHRAHQIPNTAAPVRDRQRSKLTALTCQLDQDNALSMSTTARSCWQDLPLIGVTSRSSICWRTGRVSVTTSTRGRPRDHRLCAHRTGPGSCGNRAVPAVLDGHPAKFPAGERFCYCNGGYVILALIAERVSGAAFHQLVRERVCIPAGMTDTEFLRSDELPGRTALGYLPIAGRSRRTCSTCRSWQRGWRDLLHCRGHHHLLAVAVHRKDRSCRLGGGNGASP